jgi:very-short-patch-repair endonuclease
VTHGPNSRPDANNSPDPSIRALAETQGGYVKSEQLHALGLSKDAVHHRVTRGFLIRVYRGVYAVGHLPRPPLARAHGALLAVGERSALSHHSAGSYWAVHTFWRPTFEVITPLDRRPKGVIVHHCTTLTRADIHLEAGLRITSAARTALDLTPRLDDRRANRMVRDLRIRRKLTRAQLRSVIDRNPNHRGATRLKLILLGSQREPTRSELEDIYLQIVRRWHLPVPEINVHVNGHRVDFLYREQRLIVEVDGYDAHSDPAQFAEDRRRDREILTATGIATIRFTYDDCVDRPETVAATVRAALIRQR